MKKSINVFGRVAARLFACSFYYQHVLENEQKFTSG